ncbi:MAG: diguanylate cyclase [Deltaproteobacteria bacterium]|nr:diguanylate cyclase [Deltaproteobacteria bacterium]MBW2019187.1 diguanylate cyclase [Deltaproteobacteria bacterium]MBW2073990.1 diguanylate cyclase [Deltaproteobacteria bacterium]
MAKILVVDDSRLIAHVAKTILTKRGHDVIVAQDGLAGLEAAKSEKPNIILLDLIMPVMDGYQVCQQLKEESSTKEIPVIMLTSKAEPADKVKGLEMGALDYVTKPFDEGELVARVNIQLQLQELYKALQEKNRQLQEMANRDGLTGLYNHRYFHEQLSKDFLRARRYHEALSCVLLDIDFFKKFNDTYGHQTGDVVLNTLGRVIKDSIRDSDLAARYGGEEFALVLYHTDGPAAFQVAERLRQMVEGCEIHDKDNVLHVTISVGIATFPHEKIHDSKELIECADKALYRAKEKGRNRVEVFEN